MNRGLVYAGILVVIWSWVTPFITLLSEDFDVFTQNFYRFLAGGLILLPIALFSRRKEFLEAIKAHWPKLLLLALVVFLVQTAWVKGIYMTTPTTAVLIADVDVVSIALLSALFFEAERDIVRRKYFLAGSALAIVGVIGVALGKEHAGTEFNAGVALVLARSVLWASYIVSIRALMDKENPLVIAAWVYLLSSILLLPTVLVWGDIGKVTVVPVTTNVLLFGSGALCVGIGNALNFAVIKRLGSTISVTLLLVIPFTTGIISYLIWDETLTAVQIGSGMVIILSCLLIVRKVVTNEAKD